VWLDNDPAFGQAKAVEINPPLMEPAADAPAPAMSLAGWMLNICTAITSGFKQPQTHF